LIDVTENLFLKHSKASNTGLVICCKYISFSFRLSSPFNHDKVLEKHERTDRYERYIILHTNTHNSGKRFRGDSSDNLQPHVASTLHDKTACRLQYIITPQLLSIWAASIVTMRQRVHILKKKLLTGLGKSLFQVLSF